MFDKLLSTLDLKYTYPNGPSFHFSNLNINTSEHLLILGDSGKGKSTLLNLLGGLSQPSSGKVWLKSTDLYSLPNSSLDRFRVQNIGFIFQEAHLLKNLSLKENILLAQTLAKKKKDEQLISEVLIQLDLIDQKNKIPNQLSRGQLQRAAIARAVINSPAILIADEPTASLDDNNTNRVLELLLEMANRYVCTLIIATHDKRVKDCFSNTYLL